MKKSISRVAGALLPCMLVLPIASASASDSETNVALKASGTTSATDVIPPEVPASQAYATDLDKYARYFDLSEEEAHVSLQAQIRAGEVVEELRRTAEDHFAFARISQGPGPVLLVGSTEPSLLVGLTDDLDGHRVAIVEAPFSVAELRAVTAALHELVPDHVFAYDSALEGESGTVRLDVASERTARTLKSALIGLGSFEQKPDYFSTPQGVAVRLQRVPETSSPVAFLLGGRALSDCTSGFPIWHSHNGNPNHASMLTAGHCPDPQSFGGCTLPTFSQNDYGNRDRQAMGSGSCNSMPATFFTGSEQRRPTQLTTMILGGFYCKYGKTTLAGCGEVQDDYYDPNGVEGPGDMFTFMTDFRDNKDLAEGGDSGGPWFTGTLVAGITTQQSGKSAIVNRSEAVLSYTGNYRLRTVDS